MNAESFSLGCIGRPNEDRLAVKSVCNGIMAVLADGMGGLSLGDVAADVVVDSVTRYLLENYHGNGGSEILRRALECADKDIRETSIRHKSNMGAAVAVAIITDSQLYCTWQGNVRVYVRHQGETKLLTTDHIANVGYGNTAITRCIKGSGLREDVPFLCHRLYSGDQVFICTDGLYKADEQNLGKMSIEALKEKLDNPEDDASLVQITV